MLRGVYVEFTWHLPVCLMACGNLPAMVDNQVKETAVKQTMSNQTTNSPAERAARDARPEMRPEAPARPAIQVCPYLGSWEDPITAYSYVTIENCCQHVTPPATVKAEHQRSYCLTYHHPRCPIYRQQDEVPLPTKQAAKASATHLMIPVVVLCVIFILAIVLLAGMVW
jgi:hypothetical protein